MAKFRGAELVCQICGKKFRVPPSRAEKATTCSHECSVKYRAQGLMRDKIAKECPACKATFFVHQSHAGRTYCSRVCKHGHKDYLDALSQRTRGERNGMWNGGTSDRVDGYVYENCPAHPFSCNGYVLQHRLVVERHLRSTANTDHLVKLGDNWYLDPELVVHHKNFDRKDNRIENLRVMTNSNHQGLHNRLRAQQK